MSVEDPLEFDQADRLRRALRISNVSVQEMADELVVERNTVGRYINGHTRPNRATLVVWAMKTGVPVEWLDTGAKTGATPTAREVIAAATLTPATEEAWGARGDEVAAGGSNVVHLGSWKSGRGLGRRESRWITPRMSSERGA